MHKLTEAENGFIKYDDLCKEVSTDVVDSTNLIHTRPTANYAYDLEGAPDEAIVTAESPASAAAKKIILRSQ